MNSTLNITVLESLLSGLVGALIGSGLAVVYQYVSLAIQRRSEILFLAVDYFDELNYLSRQIEQYKEKKYKECREVFSREKYLELCNKTDRLLTSSSVHARVAVIFGENSKELDSFNILRQKLTDAALLLFQANAHSWDEASQSVFELFEKEIDPLRQATERALIQSTQLKAVLCRMIK